MSQLKAQITEDIKSAMKSREALRLDTLRFLQAAIKNREIEMRPDAITDDEVMGVIKKLIKQRRESIEQFQNAGRTELADKEQQELKIMEVYLPAQMSSAQVEALVAAVITETGATSVKDMGKVMKETIARAAGKADSKMVSEIVKSKLT